MHSTTGMAASNVPAFLTKLWALVENPACDDLICWDVTGKSFHVFDQGRFSKEILPQYFKHSNIASFIRQLNMYGFRKVVHIDQGLKTEKDDLEFQHAYFQRGQEHLLEHIKRKISGHLPAVKIEQPPAVQLNKDEVHKVLNDVHTMKGKQETMNTKIENIKRENEVLWREVASLRQKHIKQQQIVNKLIQFLVHLVGGNRGLSGLKRKTLPLMIQDSTEGPSSAKITKYGKSLPLSESDQSYTVQSPLEQGRGESYKAHGSGLTIHDITDQLSPPRNAMGDLGPVKEERKEVMSPAEALSLPEDITSPPLSNNETIKSIDLNDLLQMPDLSEVNQDSMPLAEGLTTSSAVPTSDVTTSTVSIPYESLGSVPVQLAPVQNPVRTLNRQSSVSEMTEHLDSLQYDLDSLKDVLSTGQYNIDPSLLFGLFNPEAAVSLGSEVFGEQEDREQTSKSDTIAGNELIQYKTADEALPDLFDLAEFSRTEDDPLSASTVDGFKTQSLDTPQVSAEDLD